MTGLYEQIADNDAGRLALASARLRYEVLGALHKALEYCGLSQSDLARRLNLRRSAVNQVFRGDGNVRISTFAEYLFAMGYEADIQLVRAGEPRRAALEGRQPVPAFPTVNTAADVALTRQNTPVFFSHTHPAGIETVAPDWVLPLLSLSVPAVYPFLPVARYALMRQPHFIPQAHFNILDLSTAGVHGWESVGEP
jgi:transcriptional regulator with XRE-family HTH domain